MTQIGSATEHSFDDDEDRAQRDCEADDFAVVVQTWTLTGMQNSVDREALAQVLDESSWQRFKSSVT